jgi:transposase
MNTYHNFIGIDIGKNNFTVALYGQKAVKEYTNDSLGIKQFFKDFKSFLPNALMVLEATGGDEMEVLFSLHDKKYAVHRAHTRKVKNFIHSFGNVAKTDELDAKALAFYGYERHKILDLFMPASNNLLNLYTLVQRRKDLTQQLVAEKNRAKGPRAALIHNSCQAMITTISDQIKHILAQINELIKMDPTLSKRRKILKGIPGIGDVIAQDLLALMPELGTLGRKQIASLAGLAPRANDSGKFKGYRHTGYGRNCIRPSLFLSAMAARNSHSELKTFYTNLINRGKKKMVALTALMRKILVIANARIRDLLRIDEMVECGKSA